MPGGSSIPGVGAVLNGANSANGGSTRGLTVKGVAMNETQRKQAEILLGVVNQLKAGQICAEAIICAAIGESTLTNLSTPNGSGYWGVLQGGSGYSGSAANFPPPSGWNDSTGMATAFLQGGKGFGNGFPAPLTGKGAIDAVRAGYTDPGAIANGAEDSGAGAAWYGQYLPEAKAIVAALGGAALKGGVAGSGSGASGTVPNGAPSSTYAFQIGGTDNPDEDYWTGTNRLAQEVNWYFFSNGEMLYYMDGEEMIGQKPALYLDRVRDAARFASPAQLTYDNTAYGWVSDHKRRFRPQRKAKLTKIVSPTEVTLDLICGIDELRAGDVVVLQSFGPGDGRWIVGDCTRSVFSPSSQITLVPPIAPITEAAAAGTTGKTQSPLNPSTAVSSPGGVALSGTLRAKVVQVAKAACAREAKTGAYSYAEVRPYPSSLFGPAPVPAIDCSSFSILCYKDAGAPDPNGTNYNGQGYTGSLVARGTAVRTPQPADLVFYSPPGVGTLGHVAVYLGNDQIANMGAPNAGEPKIESVNIYPIAAVRSYL